jgi:RNA polymerase sigma-70 factor (ECF subfamily)
VHIPTPSYNEQHGEDLALWQAFRSGDQQALGTLFDQYAQQLFAYGHHISSDTEAVKDAIQTVFVNLWAKRANLAAEVSVKFYLYSSVRRELLKLRKDARMWVEQPTDSQSEPSTEQQLMALEDDERRTIKLSTSLALLSARENEIVNLKYFNNFKIREIADMLQLSEQTVSNLLYRALQKLRHSLTISLLFFLLDYL